MHLTFASWLQHTCQHSTPSQHNRKHPGTTGWALTISTPCTPRPHALPPPTALRAAVKLGVMDAPGICESPVPATQLAAHTSSSPDHLYRLLRYLAQFGILEEHPGCSFRLTSMGQCLRSDHPSGLCHAAVSFGAPGHYVPWMHLDRAVKEGEM